MSKAAKRKTPLIARGSVVLLKRKCGKPQCRCAKGDLHPTWALSFSYKGHSRIIPLRENDADTARQAIQRYQKARAGLEARAMQGIEQIHAMVKAARRKKQ